MDKFLNSVKERSGKIGILIAVLTLAWTSISSYVQSNTRLEDVQAQQEKRISDLEIDVKNDVATRREIQDFKADTRARFDRLENMLNRELEMHHARKR
jgi:DNA polymerase II small subunit/DNA polymerase delta subunit B